MDVKVANIQNSPKLKPKNRSKFEEIRSFFEVNQPESNPNATTSSQLQPLDIEVKNLYIKSNREYLEK